ncbi:hypothetical protein E4U10_000637, partial [Claviceps purpurea]
VSHQLFEELCVRHPHGGILPIPLPHLLLRTSITISPTLSMCGIKPRESFDIRSSSQTPKRTKRS